MARRTASVPRPAPRMGRVRIISRAAAYRGKRLEVEESSRLKMVRMRLKMVSGRKGMAHRPRSKKPGMSLRFQRNTKTAAATAAPIQLARE